MMICKDIRVDAIDGDLGAAKPQHSSAEALRLDGGGQREEAQPEHRVSLQDVYSGVSRGQPGNKSCDDSFRDANN
jgi:hypothetical protein